jgi:hypothetical protein
LNPTFSFGASWLAYAETVTKSMIALTRGDMTTRFGAATIPGKRVMDFTGQSGIHCPSLSQLDAESVDSEEVSRFLKPRGFSIQHEFIRPWEGNCSVYLLSRGSSAAEDAKAERDAKVIEPCAESAES